MDVADDKKIPAHTGVAPKHILLHFNAYNDTLNQNMVQLRVPLPVPVVRNRIASLMSSRVCIIFFLIFIGFYQATTMKQFKLTEHATWTDSTTTVEQSSKSTRPTTMEQDEKTLPDTRTSLEPSSKNTAITGKPTTVEEVQNTLREMGMTPIYDESVTDPWKVELFQRLDRIRIVCGKLCQMNTLEELEKHSVHVPNVIIPAVKLEPVDCPALLALEDLDASDSTAPPIPEELIPYYTFNGAIEITDHKLRKDIYLGAPITLLWSTEEIEKIIDEVRNREHYGSYSVDVTNYVSDMISTLSIEGKSILVIGSERPWVEAVLLLHGAAKVTTLEYADIRSEHVRIKTMKPHEFRERSIAGTLESFDGMVAHSSLEHTGLGRYGDALNPWGDILAVARAWCVVKPGGFMYLGLPTGKDLVKSNWHRCYGRIRWPLVAANWMPLPGPTDGTELDRLVDPPSGNGDIGYLFIKKSLS